VWLFRLAEVYVRRRRAASSPSQYTEHRTTRGVPGDSLGDQRQAASAILIDQAEGTLSPSQSGTDSQLVADDRIVIRYLDDPKAKPPCFILTNRSDNCLNGYLSLSSPLSRAVCEALPGDEIHAMTTMATDRFSTTLERENSREVP
jgi:hypothetical protein